MTQPTKAWQTYVDQARAHLTKAEREGTGTHIDQTHALTGIGWAVLALVEVLQPQDDVMLEVTSSTSVFNPAALLEGLPGLTVERCAVSTPHEAHPWYSHPAKSVMDRACPGVKQSGTPSAPQPHEVRAAKTVPCFDNSMHAAHSHNEEANGNYDWCPGVGWTDEERSHGG